MAWNYRYYVADSLRMIPQSKHFTDRLYTMLHPAPVDKRSAEEITAEVLKKTGITLK